MRLTICLAAAFALCACSKAAETPPPADNVAEANMEGAAATPANIEIKETSWTYTDKNGTKMQESVGPDGNYVSKSADGKHVDHGKAWVQDDKVCFDSAMDKETESCWTAKHAEIGQSMEVFSDKGEKLTVTRIAYVPPPPM
jgi:hypothetical protein